MAKGCILSVDNSGRALAPKFDGRRCCGDASVDVDIGGQEPGQGIQALGIELEGDAGAPLRDVDDPPGQATREIETWTGQLDDLPERCRKRSAVTATP